MRSRGARAPSPVAPYAMVAPFVVLFAFFELVPTVGTFWMSTRSGSALTGDEWAGLDNFARLATDPRVGNALLNTAGILVLAIAPQIIAGIAIAHAMQFTPRRLLPVVRVSLLVPFVTSSAAVTIAVAQFVDADYGFLPRTLEWLGALNVDPLATPGGAWITVAATVSWRWFGFTALLYATLLQAVPREVFRAAELDGAGAWAQLRYISVPALIPGITFTVVTSTVGLLQLFTEPLLLDPASASCGAARQCQTLALLIYQLGFREFQFGYASALTVVVFVLAAALTAVTALSFARRPGASGGRA